MKVMITYPPLQNAKGFPLLSQNRQFQWYTNFTALYPIVLAYAATLLRENDFEVVWKDAIVERMNKNGLSNLDYLSKVSFTILSILKKYVLYGDLFIIIVNLFLRTRALI